MLPREWFIDVPEEAQEGVELALRSSTSLIKALNKLCDKWEREITSTECKVDVYDNPSWSARQAHLNGDRTRIRKLRDMLSFLVEGKTNV